METTPGSRSLRRTAEIALALAIAIPPFIFGAREAIGQLILAILVTIASGLAVCLRVREGLGLLGWRRADLLVPAAALSLALLTTLPLPARFVCLVSPGIERLLPEWCSGTLKPLLGTGWHYLSLAPACSRDAALLLLLHVLLFWTTLQTIRDVDSAHRLLWAWFLCGVGVAACGLGHHLFGNEKFYGIWELWWVRPERQMRMPFTNRNHFAGFLALCLAPGLLLLARQFRRSRQLAPEKLHDSRNKNDSLLLLIGAGVVLNVACVFLSQSRGGIVAACVAIGIAARGISPVLHRRQWIGGAVLTATAILGLLLLFGDSWQRLEQLLDRSKSAEELANGRLALWRADLHALLDFPLFGCGAGGHRYVYPLYLHASRDLVYTHAENCYLQVGMENGLAGFAILLMSITAILGPCVSASRSWQLDAQRAQIAVVVGASLAAALLHGFVDFVWYVPAYGASLAVLAGLARGVCRRTQDEGVISRTVAPLRTVWVIGWVAIAGVVTTHFIGMARAQHAWDDYRRLAKSQLSTHDNNLVREEIACLERSELDHSGEPSTLVRIAELRLSFGQTEHESRASELALARECLCRSLRACPLLGESYLHLAECFRPESGSTPIARACLQEALLVRPNDAKLCFASGTENWRCGNSTAARVCWRRAVTLNPSLEHKLLQVLADNLTPEELVAFWQPDYVGLQLLGSRASERGHIAALRFFAARAFAVLPVDAVHGRDPGAWMALYDSCRKAGLSLEADACLRKVVSLDPFRLEPRLLLIQRLEEAGEAKEAAEHRERAQSLFPENSALIALRRHLATEPGAPGEGVVSENRCLREDR